MGKELREPRSAPIPPLRQLLSAIGHARSVLDERMDDLILHLSNGTQIVVPPSLVPFTTYVLLEQETWFEKEFAFVEQAVEPGQTAIDIGASYGVYSLALAKAVGPSGRVFAYEPTSEVRAKLERSRDLNEAPQLTILGKAIADAARPGVLVFGDTSELNYLASADSAAPGERVEMTSLDLESERLRWGQPDFLKIDAEPSEKAILRGGERLLTEASPLLMLEKAGVNLNEQIRPALEALGYAAYRLLPGAPLLVPLPADVDPFELNFFAAKSDRAAALAKRGLLITDVPEIAVTEDECDLALARLRVQPYAAAFAEPFAPDVPLHPEYRRALGAYGIWQEPSRPPAERFAALDLACRTLGHLLQSEPQPPTAWLLTFARVAAEYGARSWALRALEPVLQMARAGTIPLHHPFWPPSSRYDRLPTAPKMADWLVASVVETLELLGRHSTRFAAPSIGLDWLCGLPYATPAMLRRRALCQARSRQPMPLPPKLGIGAPDHLNAPLWENETVLRLGKELLAASAGQRR